MINNVKKLLMLLLVMAVVSLGLTGCKKHHDQPSGERPSSEHPTEEKKAEEKPAAEHPSGEHPAGEHPQ
ncbi:MAG: hypothetical protein JXA81_11545 [Sedimentisphaerales bacterium]|nr:hypothetical protein [Sedimentisphaerales bacterium]